jgi:hypothetical protein
MIWLFGRSADPMGRFTYVSVIRSISEGQQNARLEFTGWGDPARMDSLSITHSGNLFL